MIIQSRAPSRLSIFGGGTDLKDFSSKYGGICVNMAINIRTWTNLYIGDSIFETFTKLPYKANPKLCYHILKEYGLGSMHLASVKSEYDGYIGSGLGSSASFTVSLIAAIYGVQDRQALVNKAFITESHYHSTGKQDIVSSVYGGLNIIMFNNEAKVIPLSREIAYSFEKYIVLYWVGERKDCLISVSSSPSQTLNSLKKIKEIALIGQQAIVDGRMEIVGKLLHSSWVEKRKYASSKKINKIYDLGLTAGAMAGKLMGRGGGGYMYFFVSPEKREKFIKTMQKEGFEEIDFSTDYQGVERRIL